MVSWRPSLSLPTNRSSPRKRRPSSRTSSPPVAEPELEDDEDEDEDDDELELDDDDEDEDLVVFTAREAAGALATILGFVKPFLSNYKRILGYVAFGVLVETLFNVIMPLSLKYLIDDALGEEDFQALYKILGVLAVAGIFTSIVAVWYERWDARLAACIISDVRKRLFEHVQDLPAAYFGRTKRGEILSRFSVDLAAFEGSVKTFANSAALPFLELIAGIILMFFLNWQLALVALLVFPITLIGPRMLTPKAVQANYEQKLNESALLGMVQENVAAQAVIKAFSLQRRMFGFFNFRNDETRNRIAVGGVPVDHGGADGHHLGAAVAPRRARDRRLSGDQGPDHHRHLRHLRERVLGGLLQHRPCDALHPGVDLLGRRGPPHPGVAGRAHARRRSSRRARSAAHHPRHHLRPRDVPVRRQPDAGAGQSQPQAQCRQAHRHRRPLAAPARARCSI